MEFLWNSCRISESSYESPLTYASGMVQRIPRQLWSGILTSLFFNLSYDFLTNLTLWETNKKQKKIMFLICLRCILFSSIVALSGSHWISKVCLVFCKEKIVYLLFPIESILHISLNTSQRCRKLLLFRICFENKRSFHLTTPPPPTFIYIILPMPYIYIYIYI